MKFKELRKERNLSQLDLTKQLKIARTTYNGYETGRSEPDLQTLCQIADFYGVSLDYLCDHKSNNDLDNLNAEDRQAIVDFLELPPTAKAFIRGEIRTAKITAQSFSIRN